MSVPVFIGLLWQFRDIKLLPPLADEVRFVDIKAVVTDQRLVILYTNRNCLGFD